MARYQRFVVAFDNHGDMIDRKVSRVFDEFLREFKPDIRIHGGDCFDLRALRRGASDEEKCDGTKADVEAGLEFMATLNPQVFLRGNHDERLWDAAKDHPNGVIRSHASMLIDLIHDSMPNTIQLPYDKRAGVYRVGRLRVVHGYHSGMTAAAWRQRHCVPWPWAMPTTTPRPPTRGSGVASRPTARRALRGRRGSGAGPWTWRWRWRM